MFIPLFLLLNQMEVILYIFPIWKVVIPAATHWLMAEDALALILYGYEKDQRPIPQPSKMSDIKVTADSFLSMVACDTLEYRKRFNNKAVKKTLTIPEWLNEAATDRNVNFSQVLQDALLQKLNQ